MSDMASMIKWETEKKHHGEVKQGRERQVKQMQKYLGFINKLIEKKKLRKKWRKVSEVKYKMNKKQVEVVQEEIQRILAKQQRI